MARRFRFSLRRFLLLIAVFDVLFYFLFVRPTVLANHVLSLVEKGDLEALSKLGVEIPKTHKYFSTNGEHYIEVHNTYNSIEGRIQPRQWSDVWHCRRRVEIKTNYSEPDTTDPVVVHKAVDT